jgi:hypothetical protein
MLKGRLLITCAHGFKGYNTLSGFVDKEGENFSHNGYLTSLRALFTRDINGNPPNGIDPTLANDGRFGTGGIEVENVIILPGRDVALLILKNAMPGAEELDIAVHPVIKDGNSHSSDDKKLIDCTMSFYGLGTGYPKFYDKIEYNIEDWNKKISEESKTKMLVGDKIPISVGWQIAKKKTTNQFSFGTQQDIADRNKMAMYSTASSSDANNRATSGDSGSAFISQQDDSGEKIVGIIGGGGYFETFSSTGDMFNDAAIDYFKEEIENVYGTVNITTANNIALTAAVDYKTDTIISDDKK